MKIWYVANIRFPTEKAHGLQVAAMVRALFEAGQQVALVLPRRRSSSGSDAYTYYDIPRDIEIIRIWNIDTAEWGRVGFLLQYFQFALLSGIYIGMRAKKHDLLFSREYLCCAIPIMRGLLSAWESHRGEWNMLIRVLSKCGMRIVAISRGLESLYNKKGVSAAMIYLAPDGVDLSLFTGEASKAVSRARLGLAEGAHIALYAGHLYGWKGVDTLAEAASLLPESWLTMFVGGTDSDIEQFKERHQHQPRVLVVGRRSHDEIPTWLRAADVVVLPNSGKTIMSAQYTSPLKLFEYMASGTPIVASDVPSIREILDDTMAVLVPPDDPKRLAQGILAACGEYDMAKNSKEAAPGYSWSNRADGLLVWLGRHRRVDANLL